MNLLLKNWLDQHKDILDTNISFPKLRSIIATDTGIDARLIKAQDIFDVIYPNKKILCDNIKFIGYAVGYRTCKKGCACYIKRVSDAVVKSKSEYSLEQRNDIKLKRTITNIERYGVANVSHDPSIVDKIKASHAARSTADIAATQIKTKFTVRERYGVDNVMQNNTISKKNAVGRNYALALIKQQQTKLRKYGTRGYNNVAKTRSTLLAKYGVDNVSKISSVREKISKALGSKYYLRHQDTYNVTPNFSESEYSPGDNQPWTCNTCASVITGRADSGKFTRCIVCAPKFVSAPELEIQAFLDSIGIKYVANDRTIISPKELDLFLPDYDVAIEYCGNYWHREQNGKDRHYHQQKLIQCVALGIKLITIFSDQWTDRREVVESRLTTMLGLTGNKIAARKCSLGELSSKEANDFMDSNHLQYAVNSAFSYGLKTPDGNLVACMQFSSSRFEKNKIELTRFAVDKNWSVAGAASRLLACYIRLHNPRSIVTYSDNCWGYTEFYKHLGFVNTSLGVPGYAYINVNKSNIRHSRMKFQKHKLNTLLPNFDSSLTEYDNMLAAGYDRIWDCGHSRWEWNAIS